MLGVNIHSPYEKPRLSSAGWWPYVKYGALIALAAATAYVVLFALTK
jgi:hypothetical protein